MKVAFDVDGTLIVPDEKLGMDVPNYEVINIYKIFKNRGNHMIIWSGSGNDYAKRWSEKLGLHPNEIKTKKKSQDVDVAFDDQEVDLAEINIQVGFKGKPVSIPSVWIPLEIDIPPSTITVSSTSDKIDWFVANHIPCGKGSG